MIDAALASFGTAPALDAATVEACAKVAEEWRCSTHGSADDDFVDQVANSVGPNVAAAIRKLLPEQPAEDQTDDN